MALGRARRVGEIYPLGQRVLRMHPHPNPPPPAGEGESYTPRGGATARRKKLITLPTAANPAPSASASVAPSRPASPKHNAASAAPIVWPVRRAVATMPLAPPLRSGGALDISALRLGV